MLSTITSGAVYGIHSHLIQVEVDVSQGLPCFQMVGLPGSEVREARERVKVALKNMGVKLPPVCINVNLSPADLPKSGTMFDLPVAVGIMIALARIPQETVEDTLLIGELGLSGELKPVKGVLPIVQEAARQGIRRCILPAGNAWEGALIQEIESIGMENVDDTISFLLGHKTESPLVRHDRLSDLEAIREQNMEENLDFADISGQERSETGGGSGGGRISSSSDHTVPRVPARRCWPGVCLRFCRLFLWKKVWKYLPSTAFRDCCSQRHLLRGQDPS